MLLEKALILGGTGGDMPEILRAVESKGARVRAVATAVTLESAWKLLEQTKAWKNIELAQIAVNRLEPVASYHMFKAQNPVFLFSADWEGEKE